LIGEGVEEERHVIAPPIVPPKAVQVAIEVGDGMILNSGRTTIVVGSGWFRPSHGVHSALYGLGRIHTRNVNLEGIIVEFSLEIEILCFLLSLFLSTP
jgi:hypothetical protein